MLKVECDRWNESAARLREEALNLVHFETWSSAGSVRLSAHAEVLPATKSREQDAPTTFKTIVLKIDVV